MTALAFLPFAAWAAAADVAGKATVQVAIVRSAPSVKILVADGDADLVLPGGRTKPLEWKGELTFRRSPDRIYEYACHEGNYSVPNILGGAREMEREGRKQPVITSGIGRLDRPTPENMPKR